MSIGDKNRVKNKLIFETIPEVSKSKNAKKEAERLEKMDKTINYDKLSITDKNNREVIGFAKYMDFDAFARKKFYRSISRKEAEKMQDEMGLKIKKSKKVQSKDTREKGFIKNNY